MKERLFAGLLVCMLALSGCSKIYDGSYSTVRPHVRPQVPTVEQPLSASSRQQLQQVLEQLIATGKEEAVVSVADYEQQTLKADMQRICDSLKKTHPVSAYALDTVSYELGRNDGQPVLSLAIRYTRNKTDILSIRSAADMEKAADQIRNAMARCDVSLVLNIANYEDWDLLPIVERYALENPQLVMEIPQLSWKTYPSSGQTRVLEVFFTYQTGRDSLKAMQEKVGPVFESAKLYVSGDASEKEKFSQLYSFLMERYDYQYDTSITPTYSLLRHGVGDSRAFAMVYAAMCRQAELECIVVSGTKDGESRYWNIISRDGACYHVDLLSGRYREKKDEQMTGYVWDYSAYPICSDAPIPREPTVVE